MFIKHRTPFTQLYVHLVWGTWNRRRQLEPKIRATVFASFQAKCAELKVLPIAIGGTEDHVHLLLRIPPALALATLVKHLKGSSSHLVNHQSTTGRVLRWQGGYGAFTVSRRHVPVVRAYVLRQEERHRASRLNRALESFPPH